MLVKCVGVNTISSLHLADFGVSQLFEEHSSLLASTVAGTPFYMAPEVMNANKRKEI